MTVDWKSLVAQAQPTTRSVRLCLRGDLVQELSTAEAAGDVAEDLRQQVTDATVTFTLKGLTRQAYRALEAKHPAPDGAAGWNVDSFPESLVRACLTDPSVDATDPLFDVLTPGQVEKLFEAAYLSCNEVDDLPL
jgi:hypothetical protein